MPGWRPRPTFSPCMKLPRRPLIHCGSPPKQTTAALALLALGVVYGDIGTSPLYAAKETFNPVHGIPLNAENILGGVSAIFWALMIVVSLKYVVLVVRANNRGEGGIMALLALATSSVRDRPRLRRCAARRRRVRHRAVLRRRRADAGHLGPFRGRGPRSRHIGVQAVRRAPRDRRSDRSVRDPAPWHRGRWPVLRAGLRPVVPVARRRRRLEHREVAGDPRSAQSRARAALYHRARVRIVRRTRLGAAGDHRRRSAVRRHGPLRQARDPHRLVRRRRPGARAELLRPGRLADDATRPRSRTRSISPTRRGRSIRWSRWRPPRPSSPRRRRSRAPIR